ncbi:MAG: hypothetical protein ABH873_03515 [Candidatus Firestonebacteria bacterium]
MKRLSKFKSLIFILFYFTSFVNSEDNQQVLKGMVSVTRSLDTYLKGVYDFSGLVGENSEVNGSLWFCEYIAMVQYPSKADGYLRYYTKTGFPEYKELAEQFIDKIYKVYTSTKDKDGKNWLPTQQFIAGDGKFYGYDQGPRFKRSTPLIRHPIPYNQSKGKYQIESAGFPDAFGIGMYELAKEVEKVKEVRKVEEGKEKKENKEYKEKLIEILNGIVDFWNRDYMRYKKSVAFLYRTEDVEPLNPQPQKKEPKWSCMGSDLIYSVLALNELGQDTNKYDTNLMLFLKTYCDERVNHSGESRIDYLDSRMIELAKYFKNKGKYEGLTNWVFNILPSFYRKRSDRVEFMLDGSLKGSSTTPLLDLYAQLGMKEQFKKLWNNIWNNYFGEEGIKVNDKCVSINNSGYPVLLDAGYQGWLKGILTDEEFISAVQRYYNFKGNERSYRDLNDWVIEIEEWDRIRPNWNATPYDCYPEQVETEGYYKGIPQGFMMHSIPVGSLNSPSRENTKRNLYYQFTSPFANHAEKQRYGLAQAFNLLNTFKNSIPVFNKIEEDKLTTKVVYKEPKAPKGLPCMGIVDVTELYYKDRKISIKDGYEVTEVLNKDKNISWQISHILDYKKPFSEENNAKLCFLIEAEGKEVEGEITIIVRKRNLPYYVTESEELKKSDKIKDLSFIEKQNQDIVTDNVRLKNAFKSYENKDFLKDWRVWCEAYRYNEKEVNPKLESNIKGYFNKELNLEDDPKLKKNISKYFKGELKIEDRVDLIISFSRIYFIYDGELKKEILKAIEKNICILLNEKDYGLKAIESLIRYGVLFPDNVKSKESLESGWIKLKEFLSKRINTEGYDKEKELLQIAKTLIEIERLGQINNIKIPDEIFKTTEKILEFLMYCSNSDGRIPSFIDKSGENIREWLYWGSKIYKRSDFRYVAFGGLIMENSFAPEKTSISCPESGIYVMRSSWDIRDRYRNRSGSDEDRQRVMIVDSKTGEFEISGYNKVLIKGNANGNYKVSKWESNEKEDILVLKDEEKKIEKEIKFVKPNYWIICMNGPSEISDELELNGVEVINEESRARTLSGNLPGAYSQLDIKLRYLGDVQVVSYKAKLEVKDKVVKLSGVYGIGYVIYPYIDDDKKCSYERISGNYKPKVTDRIVTHFAKNEVYREKRICYVPDIEVKEVEGEVKVIEKSKEK